MDAHHPDPRREVERRLILLLATLLVSNPFIVFLLTRSIMVAASVTVACVVLTQAVFSRAMPRLLGAYVFNALVVLSVFAHAEVVVLFAYPDYVIPNLYKIENGYYFNQPFLDQTFRSREFSARYRTNAQGFRIGQGQDPSLELAKVDWLVLGDSFTQGAQVEFEELFTTKLNVRFPDKVVANAGISGLGIAQEYNYFVRKGQELDPDLVILQLGSFNDFVNVEPRPVAFSDRLTTHSAFIRLLLTNLKSPNPAELPLGRWTEPFHPDGRANADFNIFYNESSPTKQRDIEAFGRYLGLFKQAVESSSAHLLVVLLPTREQIRHDSLHQVLQTFSIDSKDVNMSRPNQLLKDLTQRLGIDFLDLLPAFRATIGDLYFQRDEHLTAFGHSVMAEAIGNFLEARIGQPTTQLLSREFAGDRYPMPSHDGTLVSYQSVRDGRMELFVASPDFSSRRQLTFSDVDKSHPTLSRDNTKILFTEGSADVLQTEVVLMKVDGSDRRVLTEGATVFGGIATLSPSNTKVAYAEWSYDPQSGKYSNSQIVILDLASGTKTLVTPPDRESWRPVFSPDETTLVYIAKSDGQFDVYLHDLPTGRERPLTRTPFEEWDPQFSPSGDHVVYAAHPDDNWDLFLHTLATGQTVRLTKTKGDEWDPSFTPDGSAVLFGGRFGLLEAIFALPLAR
jgi:Tol biopolymer transport system component/lysophospholipase L1-like esterase